MSALALTAAALSLVLPHTASPRANHRSATVLSASASWAAVDQAGSRETSAAAFEALREEGTAKLWGQFKLASRPVTLRELTQTTKLDEKVLDPTATEFEIEDIRDASIKVLIGCTVASLLFAVGSDVLGLDAGFRFTGTYLIAGIPIAGLAIGSTAPGLLFLPVEAFRSVTASEEQKRTRVQRVCKHEASHLLCAYVLGLPISEIALDAKGPRVVVYDEELSQQPGQLVDASKIDTLGVVSVSGLMAEADAYGKALGASEDLRLLGQILLRATPPIPATKQQDVTRYSALMAWTIIKKYDAAFDAICAALEQGKGLADCLRAAEEAEEGKATAQAAAQAARAEMLKKETPQERAAREREEMAARGRKW